MDLQFLENLLNDLCQYILERWNFVVDLYIGMLCEQRDER